MALGKKWLVCAAVAAYVAYSIHIQPLPEGYARPWKLKTIFYFNEVLDTIACLSQSLGLVSRANVTRFMLENVFSIAERYGDLEVMDEYFDGVPVRIYKPRDPILPDGPLPAVIFFHGGGWTMGSIDMYDTMTSYLANDLHAVVISVGYRLAPEHVFPAGFDDCVTATTHLLRKANMYDVDPARVAVMGDSPGGNLAAAVSLKLRDDLFQPRLKLQVLVYPSLQLIDLRTPSYQQNAMGPVLVRDDSYWIFSGYITGGSELEPSLKLNIQGSPAVRQAMAQSCLNHNDLPSSNFPSWYSRPDYTQGDLDVWQRYGDKLLNPYVGPIFAKDHKNLPKAYIFTAHYDMLRDDGYFYARLLRSAGVEVTHKNWDNGFHGMLSLLGQIPEAEEAMKDIMQYLRANL